MGSCLVFTVCVPVDNMSTLIYIFYSFFFFGGGGGGGGGGGS